MALLKGKKKRGNMLDLNVNITALMDVMTVLLFFLIKSFTVSSFSLTPPEDIKLPKAAEETPAEETVVVSLSKKELRADNRVLTVLRGGRFPAGQIGPDQRTIVPLQQYLSKQAQKRLAIYEGAVDVTKLPPGKLLIQADQKLKFGTLKYLLHTAALSGYADYKFVVVPKESDSK